MALQGTLADFGIAEILQLIGTQQKTGVLYVEQEGASGGGSRILFLGGKIIRCVVAQPDDKDLIGNMLVAAELIPSREVQRCLSAQRKQPEGQRKRIGEILVAEGLIDRQTLDELLMLQMRERLYRLFEIKDGRYRFESHPPSFAEAGPGTLPAESVLMEGFRMLDEWPLIRTRIHNYDLVFRTIKALEEEEQDAEALERVLDDAFSEFLDEPSMVEEAPASVSVSALGPSERQIFPLIDGKRSVHRLIELSRLGEFETCKALVTLLNEGYLEAVKQAAPQARPARKSGTSRKIWMRGLALNAALVALIAGGVLLAPTAPEEGGSGEIQSRQRQNQKQLIKDALEVYAAERGTYPNTLQALVEAGLIKQSVLEQVGQSPLSYVSIGSDYDLR